MDLELSYLHGAVRIANLIHWAMLTLQAVSCSSEA